MHSDFSLKTARRAWTTLATRNLHVGIFKSPHHPPPLPPPPLFFRKSSFRIESCRKMFFGSMARWCGGSAVPILKYRRSVSFVRSGMSDESDQAGLILISRFLRFPYKKFLDELHSSTESCDTSASSAAFFEVRNVLGSAEVKFSTSETKPTSYFIF